MISVKFSPDAFCWAPRCSLGGCSVKHFEHYDAVSRAEKVFMISCHGQTREISIPVEALYMHLRGIDAAELISDLLRDPFPLPRSPLRLAPVRVRGRALPEPARGSFTVWEMPEVAA